MTKYNCQFQGKKVSGSIKDNYFSFVEDVSKKFSIPSHEIFSYYIFISKNLKMTFSNQDEYRLYLDSKNKKSATMDVECENLIIRKINKFEELFKTVLNDIKEISRDVKEMQKKVDSVFCSMQKNQSFPSSPPLRQFNSQNFKGPTANTKKEPPFQTQPGPRKEGPTLKPSHSTANFGFRTNKPLQNEKIDKPIFTIDQNRNPLSSSTIAAPTPLSQDAFEQIKKDPKTARRATEYRHNQNVKSYGRISTEGSFNLLDQDPPFESNPQKSRNFQTSQNSPENSMRKTIVPSGPNVFISKKDFMIIKKSEICTVDFNEVKEKKSFVIPITLKNIGIEVWGTGTALNNSRSIGQEFEVNRKVICTSGYISANRFVDAELNCKFIGKLEDLRQNKEYKIPINMIDEKGVQFGDDFIKIKLIQKAKVASINLNEKKMPEVEKKKAENAKPPTNEVEKKKAENVKPPTNEVEKKKDEKAQPPTKEVEKKKDENVKQFTEEEVKEIYDKIDEEINVSSFMEEDKAYEIIRKCGTYEQARDTIVEELEKV